MLDYLGRVFSAFSQLANAVLLNGHPNESISGRCYREQWRCERLVNSLFFWQQRHCRGAYASDRQWAIETSRLPERSPVEQPPKLW